LYSYKELKKRYPKFRLIQGKTTLKPKRAQHPGTQKAHKVLEYYGRDTSRCQICESTTRVQIHHLDGNPNNNRIENLAVLCRKHHRRKHNIPVDVIDELEDIPYD